MYQPYKKFKPLDNGEIYFFGGDSANIAKLTILLKIHQIYDENFTLMRKYRPKIMHN